MPTRVILYVKLEGSLEPLLDTVRGSGAHQKPCVICIVKLWTNVEALFR